MHLPTPSQSSRSMGNEGGTFHGGHPSCASKSILLFRRPQTVGVIHVPLPRLPDSRKAHATPRVGGLSAERRVAFGMGSREQPEAAPVVPSPKRGSLPQLVETPTRNPSQRAIRGKPDIHDTHAFYDACLPRARGKHDIPANRTSGAHTHSLPLPPEATVEGASASLGARGGGRRGALDAE